MSAIENLRLTGVEEVVGLLRLGEGAEELAGVVGPLDLVVPSMLLLLW